MNSGLQYKIFVISPGLPVPLIPLKDLSAKSILSDKVLSLGSSMVPPIIPVGKNKGQPFDMNKILETFDELKKRSNILSTSDHNFLYPPQLPSENLLPKSKISDILLSLPPRRANL